MYYHELRAILLFLLDVGPLDTLSSLLFSFIQKKNWFCVRTIHVHGEWDSFTLDALRNRKGKDTTRGTVLQKDLGLSLFSCR